MKNFSILIIAMCILSVPLKAQDSTRFEALAKRVGDEVHLKIAIYETADWLRFIEVGMRVERAIISDSDTSDFEIVAQSSKPAVKSEWEALFDDSNLASDASRLLFEKVEYKAGMSFVEKMEAAKKMEGKHFFYMYLTSMDSLLSPISGLEIADKTDADLVLYRFSINGDQEPVEYGYYMLNPNNLLSRFPTQAMEYVEYEKKVQLIWNHSDFGNRFVAYHVERRDENGTWKRINRLPLVYNDANDLIDESTRGFLQYTDSLESNYIRREYRLIGIDVFGEYGEPSASVVAMGRDRTPPKLVRDVKAEFDGSRIRVDWAYTEPPGDLEGFVVLKSNESATGPFSTIHSNPLPNESRSFTDDSVNVNQKNFYAVFAVDTAGNYQTATGTYVMIVDSFPPPAPHNLRADVDSSGAVVLSWDLAETHDIRGFRVYRSVNSEYEFIQMTPKPIFNLTFRDTLNLGTLDEFWYYKVVALDLNFNHSEYSEPLMVKKPDTIPPQAPLLTEVEVVEGEIRLAWRHSYSTDLAGYQIYYIQNEQRKLLNIVSAEINRYAFKPEDSEGNLQFEITAIDDDGLESEPSNMKRAVLNLQPSIGAPSIEASVNGNAVELNFKSANAEEIRSVYVMRKSGNGEYTILKDVLRDGLTVSDGSGIPGQRYTYRLLLLYANGEKSPYSNEVQIKFPKP